MAIQITQQPDGRYILNIPSKYDGELNIILSRRPQHPQRTVGYYRRFWREFIKLRKACFKIYFSNFPPPRKIDLRQHKNRWIEELFNQGMERDFWRTWQTK